MYQLCRRVSAPLGANPRLASAARCIASRSGQARPRRWAGLDSHERLRRTDAEFHCVAEQTMREAAQGRTEAAQRLLRGLPPALSDRVPLDLVRLLADIQAASEKPGPAAPGER